LSVVAGYIGLPAVISEHHALANFLAPAVSNMAEITHKLHELGHSTEWMLMGISSGLAIVMIFVAYSATKTPNFVPNTGLAKVLENKWYVDELYDAVIIRPLAAFSRISDRFIEKAGIDGAVNGVGKTVRWGSDRLRLLQTGQVGFYIFVMVLGMVAL